MLSKLFTSIILSALCLSANAGVSYTATVSNAAYMPVGGTALSYSATDDGYYYNASFTFTLFNRTVDFKKITSPQPSNGGFMGSQGYLAMYETPAIVNTIILMGINMDSFRHSISTSAYGIVEGAIGNRILKMEWRNLVYGADTNRKASFQIWLHEKDSSISYHYGPSTLSNAIAANPFCGLVVVDAGFTNVLDECMLSGDASGTLQTHSDNPNLTLPQMDAVPADGTVITFKRSTATGIKTMAKTDAFAIYPNPAHGYITVTTAAPMEAYIYDANGKKIQTIKCNGKTEQVDISCLAAGTYILKAGNNVQRFMVN